MPIRNLKRVFAPKHVAVIGGSRSAGSIGRTVLQNLADTGFPGAIYPVNPKHRKLGELPCFATVDQVPQIPDLAVICTPAPTVPQLVRECGQVGIRGLVVLTAGFRESGASGTELEEAVRREAGVARRLAAAAGVPRPTACEY